MFTVKSKEEFIAEIRAISPTLQKIRLSEIKIGRKERDIEYVFICPEAVDQEINDKILEIAESITEPCFQSVQIKVRKIVSNAELINNEIYKYLNSNYPSLSIFLKTTDVNSKVVGEDEREKGERENGETTSKEVGDLVKYSVKFTKDGCEYVRKNRVLDILNGYLANRFCSDFVGEVQEKEPEETISLLSDEVYKSQIEKIEHRTIKVDFIDVIDDVKMDDIAQYIEDVEEGDVTVCGKVLEIKEKKTKTDKPFFLLTIDDTTDKVSGIYFSRKNTVDRIRKIEEGDAVIAKGKMERYNGKKSFRFEKINGCHFPENFVKKEKYKKHAPKEYSVVFPEKSSTVRVKSVFDMDFDFPEEFNSQTFVVFDLETTGTDATNDGITEIGAVKIKDGKICEHWTTLVHPEHKISDYITGITGITNEMVANAPKIEKVLPDFMKFIEGATVVCHNASFDTKFIRKYANAEDYEFSNKVMDTMDLARQYVVGLKRFGLHDLAERFGVVFNHHRALSDAYATAEVFIEMNKIKYSKG